MTEQQFAGLQEAPAVLGPLLMERLGAEKRVRVPFNPRDRWLTAAREACRSLADGVQASMREGATPVVLGGECTLVAGALAGALAAEPDLSLVYLDAHGDFNTLATTPSHYVSGMVLAHLCGRSVARDRVRHCPCHHRDWQRARVVHAPPAWPCLPASAPPDVRAAAAERPGQASGSAPLDVRGSRRGRG